MPVSVTDFKDPAVNEADRCSAQSYTKSELKDELDQFPDSMGRCGKATSSSETSGLAFLLSL